MTTTSEIADAVYGTSMSHAEINERFGILEDEIDDVLAEYGLFPCSECDVWTDDIDEDGVCGSCGD